MANRDKGFAQAHFHVWKFTTASNKDILFCYTWVSCSVLCLRQQEPEQCSERGTPLFGTIRILQLDLSVIHMKMVSFQQECFFCATYFLPLYT